MLLKILLILRIGIYPILFYFILSYPIDAHVHF